MWLLVLLQFLQATVCASGATATPNIYCFGPLVFIVLFIIAAAGMTKGGDIFQFFGVGSLLGITQGIGTGGAGKGFKAAKPASRAKAMSARYSVGKRLAGLGTAGVMVGAKAASKKIAAKRAAGAEALGSGKVGAAAMAGSAIAGAAVGKTVNSTSPNGGSVTTTYGPQGKGLGMGGMATMSRVSPKRLIAAGARGTTVGGVRRAAGAYERASGRAQNFDQNVLQTRINAYNTAHQKFVNAKGGQKITAGLVSLGSRFRLRTSQKGIPILRSIPGTGRFGRIRGSTRMHAKEEKLHTRLKNRAGKAAFQISKNIGKHEARAGISSGPLIPEGAMMGGGAAAGAAIASATASTVTGNPRAGAPGQPPLGAYGVKGGESGKEWALGVLGLSKPPKERRRKSIIKSKSVMAPSPLSIGGQADVYQGYRRTVKDSATQFKNGVRAIKSVKDPKIQEQIKQAGGVEALLLSRNGTVAAELAQRNPVVKDGLAQMQAARERAAQAQTARNFLTGGKLRQSYEITDKNGKPSYNSKFFERWRVEDYRTNKQERHAAVAQQREMQRMQKEERRAQGGGDLLHRKWVTSPQDRISTAQNQRSERNQRRQQYEDEIRENQRARNAQSSSSPGPGGGGSSSGSSSGGGSGGSSGASGAAGGMPKQPHGGAGGPKSSVNSLNQGAHQPQPSGGNTNAPEGTGENKNVIFGTRGAGNKKKKPGELADEQKEKEDKEKKEDESRAIEKAKKEKEEAERREAEEHAVKEKRKKESEEDSDKN